MKKIGYAKLGRSIKMNPAKYGPQGDPEAPQLLARLARRNPDVEWWLIGKNDRYMENMPPNVVNPWIDRPNGDREVDYDVGELIADLDGFVLHLGQHGTSNMEIPMSKHTWEEYWQDPDGRGTSPLEWALNYGGYLVHGLNALGDRTDGKAPVVYICVDPRNFHKARDFKWPTGTDHILAQYEYSRTQRHERFLDPRTPEELGFTEAEELRDGELWLATHHYFNSGAELMILPDDWDTWGQLSFEERVPVGIASTSFYVPKNRSRRSWLINRYILDMWPDAQVYGKYDKRSMEDVPEGVTLLENTVEEFPTILGQWRVTLSLPPTSTSNDGLKWAVAKPYQAFAANTVCFLLGAGDEQGWILPSRSPNPRSKEVAAGLYSVRDDWTEEELHLARWLRVNNEDEFHQRAQSASRDKDTWNWLVTAQRNTLKRRWDQAILENTIEEMLSI